MSTNDRIDWPEKVHYPDETVGIGEWIGLLILLAIPIVNVIGVIYLAVAAQRETLRNYGKASLIIGAIIFVLGLIGSMM